MKGDRRLGLFATLLLSPMIWAEGSDGPTSPGHQQIERLSGCFEVTYRFAEDGVHDMFSEDYGLTNALLEWLELETLPGGSYRLTHVSVLEERVVPHFHEIWTPLSEEGTWRQEVYSHTPGNPRSEQRYTCTAAWQQNTWSCHAGKAKKPFRDRDAPFGFDRQDYDHLDRHNTLLVTPHGWVQSQQNLKQRESGEVVSRELGWITYHRVDDERCRQGHDWARAQREKD
ncbi:hypothetical protein GCM10007160_35270 [Litchfieldella qijiaojingensis]|uniref:Uncharacterized protein n=1 Tax=Litchfieldella qijiaojingensis TaxID=980347 RepID=A0ABQ2Z496_9GAMM|nr:DUF6607 family protein [Halomonas qijiaojingensis]GGY04578.1 hypothetical protein GCM10007160_35270 [Halomonas qijiaojingensis]